MSKRKSGNNTSKVAAIPVASDSAKAAANVPFAFRYTPLSKLFRSEYNVRKTGPLKNVEELADLMAVQGVIQNLVIYDEKDAQGELTGRSGVVGGGRREAGLKLNYERGLIPLDYPVPTLVIDESRATEYSLAENRHEPMHPADEFAAFKSMADAGKSIEDIAAAFGVSVQVVQRRLKLANVAPDFVQLYREGGVTLDHMMAFARLDDHDEQRRVWNSLGEWQKKQAHVLRSAIENQTMKLSHRLVKFVGIKTYEKAGGVVIKDIFSDEDAGYIADAVLLNKLATEKLETKAAKLMEDEGFTFVQVVDSFDYSTMQSYPAVFTTEREPTKKEAAQLAEIEASIEKVQQALEKAEDEGDEAEQDKQSAKLDALNEKESVIRESLETEDADQLAVAGALIAVEPSGRIKIQRNRLRLEDFRRFRAAAQKNSGESDTRARPAHSESLVRRLTAHRTLALQVEVARRPDVALAAMVAHLAYRLDHDVPHVETGSLVSASESRLADHFTGEVEVPAVKAMEELHHEVAAMLEGSGDDLLGFLMKRSQDELLRLLAFYFARTLHAVRGREDSGDAGAHLAEVVGLDMAKWWKPTGASYLAAISKPQLLAIVTEQGGADDLPALAKLNKSGLVGEVEARLDGQNWLPTPLRAA